MAANDSYVAQSITGTGKLQSISVDLKKYGLPDVSIRAKVYADVPVDLEDTFPLNNYVGQSTNVVAASGLTTDFVTHTFYFNNLQVSGQWTVVFEYESDVTQDTDNFVLFAVTPPYPDLYTGGDFCYYVYNSTSWSIFYGVDLVFTCVYCDEATTTTTTTVAPVCYLWSLENQDQTLITWTYTECNGEETIIYQEVSDPAILVCSEEEPVPSGNGLATNTQEVCTETPTTTTTTEGEPQ